MIIFNGDDEVLVTPHQLEAMGKQPSMSLVKLFQATAIYNSVVDELIQNLGEGRAEFESDPKNIERVNLIRSGFDALSDQLVNAFGVDTAARIMADTYNSINLEKESRDDRS